MKLYELKSIIDPDYNVTVVQMKKFGEEGLFYGKAKEAFKELGKYRVEELAPKYDMLSRRVGFRITVTPPAKRGRPAKINPDFEEIFD